jgi:predicted nucleotidyltransferase
MAAKTDELLRALLDAQVEFIVVGGTAAIAHGALTPTQDLDIAAPMTEANLSRLMQALSPFHPKHATRLDLGEVWQSPRELTKFRLLLLQTDIGRLDVLGRIDPLGPYESLKAVEMDLLESTKVRVLELDQLIEVKAHLTRPKDKIVEAELRAVADALRQRDES